MAFDLGVCQVPVFHKRPHLMRHLETAANSLPDAEDGAVRGLLALPEIFYGGFDYARAQEWAAETPSLLAELHDFAREHRVALAGTLWEAGEAGRYNALYLVDPTRESPVCVHRKQHLFPQTKEEDHFIPGETPPVTARVCSASAARSSQRC